MKARSAVRWFLCLLCTIMLFAAPSFARQFDGVSAAPDNWSMFGHDSAHTSRSSTNGPNTANLAWTYSDGIFGDVVVGPDGTIYGRSNPNNEATLQAVNPSGASKWKLDLGFAKNLTTPSIASNGTIYIGSSLVTSSELLALNPSDGHTLWSYPISGYITTAITIGPDQTIYFGTDFSSPGALYAINPNGTLKWKWDAPATTGFEATGIAISPYNGDIVFRCTGCGLTAVKSNGQLRWMTNDDAGNRTNSPSIGPDGTIYLGRRDYAFRAFNPDDGSLKWTVPTLNWMNNHAGAISADGATIYNGDNGGIFYSFDKAGYIKWQYDTGLDVVSAGLMATPVLSANGMVYFTTEASTGTPDNAVGKLFAVRADIGTVVWTYDIGWGASPALGPDGTLYVTAYTGTSPNETYHLYAFRCADGQCALPQPTCSAPASITSEADLGNCIQRANILAGPQTLGLAADITLQAPLPAILSEIVLNGNGHFISGNNARRVFQVNGGGNLTLNGITVQNGKSVDCGGGILINTAGTVTVNSSVLAVNAVWYPTGTGTGGGGICNAGTLSVVNSTFTGNSSTEDRTSMVLGGKGGGIYNAGTLTVTNSTFSGNSVIDTFGEGGAIFNSGTLNLKNSILANSTGFDDCYNTGTIAANVNNLIESGYTCPIPLLKADPQLGPLANNGGFTKTFALPPTSPALNAGDDAVCAAAPVSNNDQRGVIRPQGTHCDIGAFELAYLKIEGNTGVGGVTLTYYTDYDSKTVTSDTSGNYSISVPSGWSGAVRPSRLGYTFTPTSRGYSNVTTTQTGQNFTAAPYTPMIAGLAGIGGATLSYTDGVAKTVTADSSGGYTLYVSYGWSGTVTPTKPGYYFIPAYRAYTNVTTTQGVQGYTAFAITYTISGNAGVGGATLSYTDGVAKTATADSSGNYSLIVSYNWSGMVTPAKPGYTFTPTYRTYTNVTANLTGQDYTTDSVTFTISGNAGAGGATLSYTDGIARMVTADGSGNYMIIVSYGWSGMVTPSKVGYAFTPGYKNYTNVTTNQAGQDYTAVAITYTILGNAGVGGATLHYTDGIAKTVTADNSGNYTLTVSFGWSGTVTPSNAGYTFTPGYRGYSNVMGNQVGQDYQATACIFLFLPIVLR